jgi:predicted nucleotidyltransferase
MTEQRTTPEQRAALRKRYARHPDWWMIGGPGHKPNGDADVLALCDDADALAVALKDVEFRKARIAELFERIELSKTPCKCDPPGSGEEYCTGHCFLNEEIERLRKVIKDAISAGEDAIARHLSPHYAALVTFNILRKEATKQ